MSRKWILVSGTAAGCLLSDAHASSQMGVRLREGESFLCADKVTSNCSHFPHILNRGHVSIMLCIKTQLNMNIAYNGCVIQDVWPIVFF